MKKRKLVLALMLSLMMLVTMIPSFSFADETSGAASGATSTAMSGNCGATGSDVKWKLEQNNNDAANPTYTLTISGSGAMADYANWTKEGVEDTRPWKDFLEDITEIKVGEGITRIGDRAFHFINKIGGEQRPVPRAITITFPETLKEFGEEACVRANIKSVDIPESVTTLGASTFYQCKNLETITGLEGAEKIGNYAFYGCESATSDLLLTSATSIGNSAFQGCKALTNVSFPNVTTIGASAFAGCSALSGKVDLAKATEIGQRAFEGCNIESIKLLKVTSIPWGLVKDCKMLKSVVLNKNVTSIAKDIFSGCTALESIDFGGACVTLESYMFNGYKNLKSVTGLENATVEKYAFNECTALESITFGENSTVAETALNGCSGLKTVDFGGADVTVKSGMFETEYDNDGKCTRGYPNLKSVTGLKNAKTADRKAWDRAFINCKALETLDFDGASIALGSYIFTGCENLEKLSGMENVTALSGAGTIRKMNKLAAFKVPANITSINTTYLFSECPALKVIDFTTVKNLSGVTFNSGSSNAAGTAFTKSCDGAAIYVKDAGDANTIGQYAVNYPIMVTNGGTFTDNIQFVEGSLAKPTKANNKFLGWYDNADCDGTAVTTARVGMTYYAKWTPKTATTISVNPISDRTYNGNPIELTENDCIVNGSSGNITFSYQQQEGNGNWTDLDTVPSNAGTYRVKATVAEDDTYASADSDYVNFTIAKADPSYNIPQNLEAFEGQTLAKVKLPEGFTWEQPTTTSVGNPGTNTFTVTYTPADTDNYKTIKRIEVKLKVHMNWVALNEVPVINAEDKTLTVGDKFNPMDGVTATDKEDGDLTDQIEIAKNTVDTSKAGLYSVTYKVTDKGGASVEKSINVVVKEKTAPPTTVSQDGSANGTKTGDAMPIGMLSVLMLAAAAGIVFCGRKLYKSR